MSMTHADYAMTALCVYREARGEGTTGMTAVACVVRNRVARHNSTFYAQVVKPWAFSSMTARGDPQLATFPAEADPQWHQAQLIAGNVVDGLVADITRGATLYFDDSIEFPERWNKDLVVALGKIGRLNMFRETS